MLNETMLFKDLLNYKCYLTRGVRKSFLTTLSGGSVKCIANNLYPPRVHTPLKWERNFWLIYLLSIRQYRFCMTCGSGGHPGMIPKSFN